MDKIISNKQKNLYIVIIVALAIFITNLFVFYSVPNVLKNLALCEFEINRTNIKTEHNFVIINFPQKNNYLIRIRGLYPDNLKTNCKIIFNNKNILEFPVYHNNFQKEFVIANDLVEKNKNLLGITFNNKNNTINDLEINIRNYRGYNKNFPKMVIAFKESRDLFAKKLTFNNISQAIICSVIVLLLCMLMIVLRPIWKYAKYSILIQLKMLIVSMLPSMLIFVISIMITVLSPYYIIWDLLDILCLTFLPFILINIVIGYKHGFFKKIIKKLFRILINIYKVGYRFFKNIINELLKILKIIYIKLKNTDKYFDVFLLLVFIISIIYIGLIYFCLIDQYNNFNNLNKEDFFQYSQVAWNTSNGHLFLQIGTTLELLLKQKDMNTIASHIGLSFLFIAFFYFFLPYSSTFIIVQTISIGLGVIPVYLIGKELLKSRLVAFICSFIYLLYPVLFILTKYFHPEEFAITFLLFTYYYFIKHDFKKFIIFGVLSMLCREEIMLVIFMFGILSFLLRYEKKWQIIPIIIGIGSFIIYTQVIKHIAAIGASPEYYAFFNNYGYLKDVINNPEIIIKQIIKEDRLMIFKNLFMPFLFFPLLSPLTLLTGLPIIGEIWLSSQETVGALDGHPWYLCALIPAIIVSFIYALHYLSRAINKFLDYVKLQNVAILKQIILIVLIIGVLFGMIKMKQVALINNLPKMDVSASENNNAIWNILRLIPKEASIMSNLEYLPALSCRKRLTGIGEGIWQKLVSRQLYDFLILDNRDSNKRIIEYVLKAANYKIVFFNGSHTVLQSVSSSPKFEIDDWRKKAAEYIMKNANDDAWVGIDNINDLKTILLYVEMISNKTDSIHLFEKVEDKINNLAKSENLKKYNLIKENFTGPLLVKPKDYLSYVSFKVPVSDASYFEGKFTFGVLARGIKNHGNLALKLFSDSTSSEVLIENNMELYKFLNDKWGLYLVQSSIKGLKKGDIIELIIQPSDLVNGHSYNDVFIDEIFFVKGNLLNYVSVSANFDVKTINFCVERDIKPDYKKVFYFITDTPWKYKKGFKIGYINELLPMDMRFYKPSILQIDRNKIDTVRWYEK